MKRASNLKLSRFFNVINETYVIRNILNGINCKISNSFSLIIAVEFYNCGYVSSHRYLINFSVKVIFYAFVSTFMFHSYC